MATAKENAQKALESIKNFWARQALKNKIIYIASFLAVLIALIVVIAVANKKDYVVLFSNLETAEASEIVSLIEEEGYTCTLEGGTITVPEGTEDTLVMTLAMQGYPKNSDNYNFYTDHAGMFTTESENKVYERIALEQRFGAIISKLEPVENATVSLAIPEVKNTVIAAYQAPVSASITVDLKRNETLSNEQINGITRIVSYGTPGLKEENVTIVDGDGVLLLAEVYDKDVVVEETRKLKFKTDLENSIRTKIESLLSPAYNDDGFSVAVNMVLNFDSKVSENVEYSPSTEEGIKEDGRGMLQESKSENASGYAVAEGGIVGVEVNADDTYPTDDTNGNGNWSENSVDNIYLINQYKEQIEKAGYTIDGLSVSAIIYTDYLPDSTRQELVNAIGNAATINPLVVNDVVSVMSLPKFGDTAVAADEQTFLFGLTRNQLILLGAILIGLLIILIIIFALVAGNSKKKREKFEKELLAANIGAEQEPFVDNFYEIKDTTGQTPDIPSLIGEDESSKEYVVRKEIATFARERPEIVAQLLRNWMNETPEEREKANAEREKQKTENAAGGASR